MKPRAWAYVRWSSRRQEKGDSLERQTRALEHFQQQFPEVEIVETFKDAGVSAFHGLNSSAGQLRHILDHIDNGTITAGDFLLVESIDRLSRQRSPDTVQLLTGIIKKGVNIFTTIDRQLYSYRDEKDDLSRAIMFTVIAQRAYDESKTKSERAKSAHAKKAMEAEKGAVYSSFIPFGLRVIDGRYEVVTEEAKELKRLFELLKNVGLKQTVIQMNKTKTINNWTVAKIEQLLKKEHVIGKLLIEKVDYSSGVRRKVKSQIISNHYPKTVDEALFFACKEAMTARATLKRGRVKGEFNNLFQHVLKCEVCGENLYFGQVPNRNKTKNKHVRYYYCKQKLVHNCSSNHIAWEIFFYEFLDFLSHLKNVFDYEHSSEVKEWEDRAELFKELSFTSRNKQVKKALTKLENQYLKAQDELKDLNQSIAEITKIPRALIDKINQAEEQVEDLQAKYQTALYTQQQAENLDLLTVEKLKGMVGSEEGRIKFNGYLKAMGLKMSFKIDNEADTLLCVFRNEKLLYHAINHYPKVWHKSRAVAQMEKYGFDVNDLF